MSRKDISRREFLKSMAATAAGAAAAGMFPALTAGAEEAAKYTPGTYTATAAGMESDVTVTMTFDETSITDVIVDVSGETEGVGAAIGDTMAEQILAAQSIDVDSVSGASVSRNAVNGRGTGC